MTDRGEFRSWYASILDDPDFSAMEGDTFKLLFALKLTLGAKGIGVIRRLTFCDQLGCDLNDLDRRFQELEAKKTDSEYGWVEYDRAKNIVWLVNGLRYEPSISHDNAKHRTFIDRQLKPLGERQIVKRFRAYYSDWFGSIPIEGVSEPYQMGNGTVSDHKRQATANSGTNTRTSDSEPSPIARFLDRFYPASKPDRRAEVRAQLDATLTEAGARLDRHNRVKAKDEAHLTKCIKAVLDDPPDKSDAAVVWVLKKLTDPILDARGRTVTEAASEHAKAEGKRFDARIAEQRKVAAEWAKSHADELQEIERLAGVEFPANAPMGDLMRKQWILDRITDRIESPQSEAVA